MINWKPTELAEGQIDTVARQIGENIKRQLPPTMEEAVAKFGPLEITHVQLDEVVPGNWIPLYYLSSLRQKPDVFFVSLEYSMPYFQEWVEHNMVRGGLFRALPKRIELPTQPARFPWLMDTAEVVLADKDDPMGAGGYEKICSFAELTPP